MRLSETLAVWVVCALAKLVLWPAYRSTDFAVHAHWLALTHSKAPAAWYYDVSSRWTLDYPPLFAWFERLLGAALHPPSEMLARTKGEEEPTECWRNGTLSELCFSPEAVVWHRFTVAFSEALVLGLAVSLFVKTWPAAATSEAQRTREKVLATVILCALDPNLIVLDHVHFQYNGYLMGILIISLALLRSGRAVAASFTFAILLAHKHIFLYAAPLYFIHLLASYCLSYDIKAFVLKVALLGITVLSVFIPSLLSVCYPSSYSLTEETAFEFLGCMKQIGSRLFPVEERGLVHAYWAPNFWALYAGTDRVLRYILARFGGVNFQVEDAAGISSSSGLVQGEVRFDVLPRVAPWVTAALSILGMVPVLFRVWRCRSPQLLVHAYCCCVMSSFFFGYHVHEKALVMVSLPMALCALDTNYDARVYLLLTWTAQVSLAPLLFPPELSSFKLLLLASTALVGFLMLDYAHHLRKKQGRIGSSGIFPLGFRLVDVAYCIGLAFVFAVYEYGPLVERVAVSFISQGGERRGLIFERYPFVPLMLISVYCAMGVLKCWMDLYSLLERKQKAIESYNNSPYVGPVKAVPVLAQPVAL